MQRQTLAILAAAAAAPALAHVPYLEKQDWSPSAPFIVEDVTNSKSVHSQLAEPGDVDIFSISIAEPTRIYATTNIPYCPQYRAFAVTFALTGPGLPAPDADLPIDLPDGHGAVIVRNVVDDPDSRPVFFDPYGGRLTWEGPGYAIDDAPPGEYRMVVWNDAGELGDYIAVIGEAEIFGPQEIAQVQRTSPLLKNGKNLRVDCNPQADAQQQTAASTGR
jgi:hypothetical protein